jgi:hypothetical protein
MTASPQIDGRLDWNGTLALLQATFPAPAFPKGTYAWTTDFGFVNWNGVTWAMQNSATIAANTTVTQAAGTPITAELCNITSTAAGAVTLPASVPGMIITVHNISAFNVSVFPNAGGTTTEKINALGANAALVLATNVSTQLTCAVAGQWFTVPRVPS